MSDYDAVVIGAGHNGLTAANVLAKAGARVLVTERTNFLGGMAATRELFAGFKHSVGAWAVLVWPEEMTAKLDLPEWGFELMDQWSSTCSFGQEGDTPFVMYNDLERMARHLLDDHGADTATRLGSLFAHLARFAPYFNRAAYAEPPDIFEVIAEQPDAASRRDFAQMWFGSAMDTVRRFLPADQGRCIQGSLAAMSIDAFDGGPWTPGSGASMLFHYLVHGGQTKYIMPRGGIGSLSTALGRRAQSFGAEITLKSHVRSILTGEGKVTGVALRDGSEISADLVLSSLDPWTTFIDLVGPDDLPADYVRKVREINFNLGYIQAHLTLDGEPHWIDRLRPFVSDNGYTCPTIAYTPSAEYISDAWQVYRRGQLPEAPPAYLYLPSMVDHTLAPEGKHSATIFAPYFPYHLSPTDHRVLKEQYADRCIDIFNQHAPGFTDLICDRVVFSNRYFASTFSAHGGDYSHGLLMPQQLWSGRAVPGESKYATPIDGLYLCGQGTHQGPGVTGLPGWNGGHAALQRLAAANA
jgi:phytoene dehydrogenase-like protein